MKSLYPDLIVRTSSSGVPKLISTLLFLLGCATAPAELPAFEEMQSGSQLLVLRPHEVGLPFESVFGPISRRGAYALCEMPHFVIGVVAETDIFYRDSYATPEVIGSRDLYSKLQMKTERVLRGPGASQFELVVPGGTDGDHFIPTPTLYPQPVEGHRYAVAYKLFSNPDGIVYDWPDGTPFVMVTFSIDPSITLPSQAVLSNEVEAFCATLPVVP